MKQDRNEEGRFSEHGHGLGTVTEEMVRARAREIAEINGRERDNILNGDLEQARKELTEAPDTGPRSERIPEEERWNPVPGSEPTEGIKLPAPDEQTFAEKLVQEGVEEAEHEQMIQATRESLKRDQE